MNKDIIHCLECNKILRKTDHDNAPIFVFDKNLNDFISVPKDDYKDFTIEHKGHHLRELSVLEDSSISKMSCRDKAQVGYFKATNGKKVFLIKKWRNNINEPLHYKIMEDSRLKVKNVKVTCQADLIRIHLKKQFVWMDNGKIERFVEIAAHSVEKMDLSAMEECFWDTGDSMVVLAKLGFQEIREILRECQKFLTWVQLKSIRDFIEENNCDNGVMTVIVHKKMRIERFNLRGIRHKRKIIFNS
ncbi:MAG: hypothetical protein PHX78_03200 [bacterium]|nr:hypothetical protein [bacterium]